MDPSKYVYKLPEDYEMKPEHREKLDDLVVKCQLTNEEAQELIDLHVELVEEYAKEMKKVTGGVVVTMTAVALIFAALVVVIYNLIF